MTPREKSIRDMYIALNNGKQVTADFDWMPCIFYIGERDCYWDGNGKYHPSKEYIRCDWHGRTATTVSFKNFASRIAACAEIANNRKRGAIPYKVED